MARTRCANGVLNRDVISVDDQSGFTKEAERKKERKKREPGLTVEVELHAGHDGLRQVVVGRLAAEPRVQVPPFQAVHDQLVLHHAVRLQKQKKTQFHETKTQTKNTPKHRKRRPANAVREWLPKKIGCRCKDHFGSLAYPPTVAH